MSSYPICTPKEIIKILEKIGYKFYRQKGSHIMVDVSKLVKRSLKHITPYHHGGNVWDFSEKNNIPLNQLIDFSISTNPLGAPETALKLLEIT